MDDETITNVTLHGATLYNATNMSILLTMSRDEYLLAMMGPRQQEDQVTYALYARVAFDDYQNQIVKLLVCFMLAKLSSDFLCFIKVLDWILIKVRKL